MSLLRPVRALRRLATATVLSGVVLASAIPAVAAPPGGSQSPSPGSSHNGSSVTASNHKSRHHITFGIAPATPGHVDGRTYFEYRLIPGMTYRDHFVVTNHDAKPVTLTLSAADLSNGTNGEITVGATGKSATDAGKWIAIQHTPSLTIRAASSHAPGQAVIPFRVAVPKNATPGDHAGSVLATLTTVGRNKRTAVTLKQQVGIRVLIRVAGPLKPGLAVTALAASYHQDLNPLGAGSAKVSYEITNTGNVMLGARQTATANGWFGTHATALATDTPEIPVLLPGKSAKFSFTVHDVYPTFIEHLTVKLTPLVQTTDAKTVHVAPVSASVTFWAVPWLLIAIFVVLVLLALAIWWRRRRKRRRNANTPGDGPKAKELQPTG